jgi:hypothetical protein
MAVEIEISTMAIKYLENYDLKCELPKVVLAIATNS